MTTNELLILLNEKLNQNIIYTFDVYKDSVTIYGVKFSSKTIKLNKNIQEQFNQIFKIMINKLRYKLNESDNYNIVGILYKNSNRNLIESISVNKIPINKNGLEYTSNYIKYITEIDLINTNAYKTKKIITEFENKITEFLND